MIKSGIINCPKFGLNFKGFFIFYGVFNKIWFTEIF